MTSVPAYLLQLASVTFVQLLLIITAVCLVIIAQCCGVGTTPNIKQSDISFVDTIIEKVKQSPTQRVTDEFSNDEVQQLCEAVEDMFKPQKTLIRVQPPVVIVGDIHGQFSDLLRIFTTHGHPAEQQYAFLGDYVNKGPQSPEKIVFLFGAKPPKIEAADPLFSYGFYDKTISRLQEAGLHGGISDQINSMEQLSQLKRPLQQPTLGTLEVDLLWSDPDDNVQDDLPNDRGAQHSARTWSCAFVDAFYRQFNHLINVRCD
ncbi:hypothetical protein niasHT_010179 [Heterodera trifolii]|uniref:protein-serine/threonine phosphatase n=1 Tax=Heterodera trifolii TaxID=157864 RepID=A0ABD2LWZ5_9BILA